jgi:hypothetical protein
MPRKSIGEKAMTDAERQSFVEAKAKERAQIQAQIQQLNDERNKHVSAQAKAQSATNTLDSVIISTIRDQAVKNDAGEIGLRV